MLRYLLIAIMAGLVNKLYDDLEDNPLLNAFKDPMHMEMLKGLHYILLTALMLHDPVILFVGYTTCTFHLIADPTAWVSPYESSLLYSFLVLYFLVDYTTVSTFNLYDMCAVIVGISGFVMESVIVTEEYSLLKMLSRMAWVCVMIGAIMVPLLSTTLKYINAYCIGYFFTSSLVQYYSVFIAKTNLKPPVKSIHGKEKARKRRSKSS